MADNPNKKRPEDSERINIGQQHEIEYWCRVLNCTPAQLKAAVAAVGPMVKDVKKYLGK